VRQSRARSRLTFPGAKRTLRTSGARTC